MRTNPVSDAFIFLTSPFYSEPDWLHYVYWVIALASILIAAAAWRSRTSERSPIVDLWRYVIRFVLGSFWWQQSLWKFPTDTGGLRYWTEQEVQHSAFKIQATLIKTLVLPIFEPFAYGVYAFEVLVAVTLLLGLGVRIFATLGAVLICSLFLGLYQAPQEWPWSYAFLLILMITMVVDDYGLSLGLDAFIVRRRYVHDAGNGVASRAAISRR
jgi:uncharacterized membrane protein YphA (DoxX/SURF4 family)